MKRNNTRTSQVNNRIISESCHQCSVLTHCLRLMNIHLRIISIAYTGQNLFWKPPEFLTQVLKITLLSLLLWCVFSIFHLILNIFICCLLKRKVATCHAASCNCNVSDSQIPAYRDIIHVNTPDKTIGTFLFCRKQKALPYLTITAYPYDPATEYSIERQWRRARLY